MSKYRHRQTTTAAYISELAYADKVWKLLVNSGVKPSEAHKRAGISKLLAGKLLA